MGPEVYMLVSLLFMINVILISLPCVVFMFAMPIFCCCGNRIMDYLDLEPQPENRATFKSEIAKLQGTPYSHGKKHCEGGCTICLADYEEGDAILCLPCDAEGRHHFHKDCVSDWLKLHATCPICRAKLKFTYDKQKIKNAKKKRREQLSQHSDSKQRDEARQRHVPEIQASLLGPEELEEVSLYIPLASMVGSSVDAVSVDAV